MIKKLIKSLLRESLLDEVALRGSSLSDTTGLFIDSDSGVLTMSLYDPKEDLVYGYIHTAYQPSEAPYFNVRSVGAEKGYGPFIYELAMMILYNKNQLLLPSRDGDIRGEAWEVWLKFYQRSDMIKQPILLTDDAFRIDILTGDETDFEDMDEKMAFWRDLDASDRQTLKVFNTAFGHVPTPDLTRLLGIANSYGESMKKKALDRGHDYFLDRLY
jgi:hypothetical protein